jgi:Tyrosine-protein kinase ephrin type A/B receptor-like
VLFASCCFSVGLIWLTCHALLQGSVSGGSVKACTKCEGGYYADKPGMTACKKCPTGGWVGAAAVAAAVVVVGVVVSVGVAQQRPTGARARE